jgi:hypothetical protein
MIAEQVIPIAKAPTKPAGCGDCAMCCKLMRVDELRKPACQWCQHINAEHHGCTIYEDRPQTCRDFECVWLQTQYQRNGECAMPAELRPDRSRVVIDVLRNGSGLVFHVEQSRPDAHTRGAMGRLFVACVRRDPLTVVVVGDKRTAYGSKLPEPIDV